VAVGAKLCVLCLFIFKVCVAGLGAIKHTDNSVCGFFFFIHIVQEEVFLL